MPTNANPNRTALVIGAGRARGIGAVTAIRLECNGFAVTVADLVRQGEGGRTVVDGLGDTVRRIEEAGGQAIVVPFDVTDPEQIDAAINSTVDAFGGLDDLVNNAGTGIGVGPHGARVNAVAPGMIHTDMGAAELESMAASTESNVADTTNTVLNGIPLRRLGTADDVPEAISWLAGPPAYVSGAVVPVHGAAPL